MAGNQLNLESGKYSNGSRICISASVLILVIHHKHTLFVIIDPIAGLSLGALQWPWKPVVYVLNGLTGRCTKELLLREKY